MKTAERFGITEFVYRTGTTAWRVQGRMPDGRQIRANYRSFKDALAAKADLEQQALGVPVQIALRKTRLTEAQLVDAEAAYAKIQSSVTQYPWLKEKNLLFMVEYAITNWSEPLNPKTVTEAYAEFYAMKGNKNRRPRTMQEYRSRLSGLVAAHGQKNVALVLPEEVEELVLASGKDPRTQNNNRSKLSTFFRWCLRKKYCRSNPAELIELAQVDYKPPQVLTLEATKRVLRAAQVYKDGVLVPYFALGFFAALRPAEITRLASDGWTKIDLHQKFIVVEGGTAKKRKRRIVDVSDNLVLWLLAFVGKPIVGLNFRRDFDAVRKIAGFRTRTADGQEDLAPWPADVLRHTAVTAHFALHEDENKTAKWAGHNPDVMHSHYKGLLTKVQAELYWSLTPGNVNGEAIITPLPQVGETCDLKATQCA